MAVTWTPGWAQDSPGIAETPTDAPGALANALPESLPGSLLFAWLKDNDSEHPAFVAVIDADPDSPAYGGLLTTVPTDEPLTDAHHTPHNMPSSGWLPANAFRDGKTFIFDMRTPHLPRLAGKFERVGGYSFPHSFAELENGNFLVTFQTSGDDNDQPGGLLELTPEGEMVRAASAADGSIGFVRPYSLEVFPELDRVISSSADMWGMQATRHLQLWRLSDLNLLRSVSLPEGERRNVHQIPTEIRAVGDGNSAYVVTGNCGLYHLTGISGASPRARLVWDFNSQACAIPLRLGDFWVQVVGEAWQIVVLDISDPSAPQIATVRQFPDGHQPHWIAANPAGDRIVVTGYNTFADRIVMLNWNAEKRDLSVDHDFGEHDDQLPGFFTNHSIWPHGKTGSATAHGVVFWTAEEPP